MLGDINEIKNVKALYINFKMLSRGKVVLFGGETNSEINHFNALLLLSSTYFMCEVRPREASAFSKVTQLLVAVPKPEPEFGLF